MSVEEVKRTYQEMDVTTNKDEQDTKTGDILYTLLCLNTFVTTFYDLKVTFGYIGESAENFMSKYTQEV